MRIFVTGTRGIPNIPGGVEKHCQELFPRIAAKGHEVVLCTRSSYVREEIDDWRGVKLIKCYAPRKKSLEAIIHTFISLLKARWHAPDVVHIHSIGPAILTPLARLLGLKVVITNHGPDYHRQKWGTIAKVVLRAGEKLGSAYADEIISISSVIKKIIAEESGRVAHIIYNGVSLQEKVSETDFLNNIGVKPKNYLLAVARFVPEKGLHDLVEVFKELDTEYSLVVAGDADHETDYSRMLRRTASEDPRIILTGYITGGPLKQIYSHAKLFVLPSYHEGLPIALLEALSYGLPVVVSDIAAFKEVPLPAQSYFQCGNREDLKERIEMSLLSNAKEHCIEKMREHIREVYNWENIAKETLQVYQKAVSKNNFGRQVREKLIDDKKTN